MIGSPGRDNPSGREESGFSFPSAEVGDGQPPIGSTETAVMVSGFRPGDRKLLTSPDREFTAHGVI
jgi:hypothetical protein